MPTPAREPLEQKITQAWPTGLWGQVRVLVAVSGGADSIALLRAMQHLSAPGLGELVVAHFNHGLRGATALADEQFVVTLAGSLGLKCEVGHAASPVAGMMPDGIEAAARSARYQFLVQTAERLGARYVVTGHTADDQAETVLHHIVRGTGLSGLAGMRRMRVLSPAVTLLRPMLDVRRAEVIEYLKMLGQPYRDDESNFDQSLTRNRIRHELVPLLRDSYAPSIVESLNRLASLAGDAQRVIDAAAEALLHGALESAEVDRVVLDCQNFKSADRHLVREAFVAVWRRQDWPRQAMGFQHWDALADMAIAQESVAAFVVPGAIRAQKTGEQLVLARKS